MAKIGGTLCGKNRWNSLWQKWVELIVAKWVELILAKMGGAGVLEAVTKMGGAYFAKNGWSPLGQQWLVLGLLRLWQKLLGLLL